VTSHHCHPTDLPTRLFTGYKEGKQKKYTKQEISALVRRSRR